MLAIISERRRVGKTQNRVLASGNISPLPLHGTLPRSSHLPGNFPETHYPMHLIAPCRKVRAPVFAALVAGCLCGAGTPRASAAPCIPTTPISAVAAALVGQTGSSRKL